MPDSSELSRRERQIMEAVFALGEATVNQVVETIPSPHMDVICQEFKDHYHLERPHQGLENELIQKPPTKRRMKTEPNVDTIRLTDIRCDERLGGLLKSYSRMAA